MGDFFRKILKVKTKNQNDVPVNLYMNETIYGRDLGLQLRSFMNIRYWFKLEEKDCNF